MDSITKRKLNMSEVEALVKKAFGNHVKVQSMIEIEDGWFNAIYSITLTDGREVILKMAPSSAVRIMRYEKDIMRAEVEVMKLLKAKGNIPLPQVLFYDASGEIVENEYFFMEKIYGQPYNKVKETLSEEQRKAIETELGIYNRYINNVKGEKFGLYSQKDKISSKWSEAFLSMVRNVLQDGINYDVKLPKEYKEIEELFVKYSQVLDCVTEPSLVHWDLHDGNIFINEKGRINGIIDFERTLWGDPLLEFYFGDFVNKTYFSNGYGDNLLNTKEGQIRRILYNIYLYLIMVIECKYRNFQNEEHIKWTYNTLAKELEKL